MARPHVKGLPLVAGLLLAACASGSSAPTPPWRVTEADAGRSLRVPVGTTLDIALPGTPSTGYIWQRTPGPPGGVEAVGAARFEPSGSLPGSGGLVHLTFRVTGEGATALWLVYRRPFDKDAPPVQTFSVTVVGEPD